MAICNGSMKQLCCYVNFWLKTAVSIFIAIGMSMLAFALSLMRYLVQKDLLTKLYNGPRKLDTERGRNKIYSRHDEKTVYNRFQGKSGSGTLEGREDLGTNCYGV